MSEVDVEHDGIAIWKESGSLSQYLEEVHPGELFTKNTFIGLYIERNKLLLY